MNELIREIEAGQLKESVPEFSVGDTVKVKVTEIDAQNRINLSRKELL